MREALQRTSALRCARNRCRQLTHMTALGTTPRLASSVNGDAPNRERHGPRDVVREIWLGLDLPEPALNSLHLPGEESPRPVLPSSFKIGTLAQSSIALSALAAAQVHAHRNGTPAIPPVTVPLHHAAIEFNSEKLYVLHDAQLPKTESIGGLHRTSDGHVRVHEGFPNHVQGVLDLLGLPPSASRADVAQALASWTSLDVENAAVARGTLVAYALRSYQEWDALPQSKAISTFPIDLKPLSPGSTSTTPPRPAPGSTRCLEGLRVLEMSRVIAAPLCGKTLAAHGADVLWVTAPHLPDLPALDREFGRGKRTVQLDARDEADRARLLELAATCDVFIQSYRPGSLAARGLSAEELVKVNPNIIVANLSAFGPRGPWAGRKGFDSLVQTCSGMNVSEAEHAGRGEAARAMPCQALDHGAGYLLAAGIGAAVYHRAVRGGAWQVDVSLAGVMKYLRSLGQYPGDTGFDSHVAERPEDVPEEYLETRETGFGAMTFVRHGVDVEGCEVGWEVMPKPLGSDKPEWR